MSCKVMTQVFVRHLSHFMIKGNYSEYIISCKDIPLVTMAITDSIMSCKDISLVTMAITDSIMSCNDISLLTKAITDSIMPCKDISRVTMAITDSVRSCKDISPCDTTKGNAWLHYFKPLLITMNDH